MKFLNNQIKVKHMLLSNVVGLVLLSGVALLNHEININHQTAISSLIDIVSEEKSVSPEYVAALESRLGDLEERINEMPKTYNQAIERHPEIDYSQPAETSIKDEVKKKMSSCDPMKNRLHYELFAMPAPGCDY